MKIDIERFKKFYENGGLRQKTFGDLEETACLVSALTGETGFAGCHAAGWPKWLAELSVYMFDKAPDIDVAYERGLALAEAIQYAQDQSVDFDKVRRDIRLSSVLPIALHSIGEGYEPWRVACREVVQWSIDNAEAVDAEGARWAVEAAAAAEAAEAEGARWAVEAAAAVGDTGDVGAGWAAEAAEAAWVADGWRAAKYAAITDIYESTIAALRGNSYELVWPPSEEENK